MAQRKYSIEALKEDAPDRTTDIDRVAQHYDIGISDHIRPLLRHDAIRKQYMPDIRELNTTAIEDADPIGDDVHSPVKGIVHRYPDRVLLKPVHVCAVYCRYCFRREKVGSGQEALNKQELDDALSYIENTPDIWEVILTGGDPLILSPRRLGKILDRLEKITHVKSIRIHSRVPVADPERMTVELYKTLERKKATYLAVHINHATELTPNVCDALKQLRRHDVTLLSQSVLLKGVNDNAQVLEELFRRLAEQRVKPYYLHHPDLAPGTSHFRVPIAEGQALMRALRGNISGICLPDYVLDIPGGHGKVPIGPTYITTDNGGTCQVEDYQGTYHIYPPAGESEYD